MRLYLDNCCFNRPYDDLSLLGNYLEAEAKMYIQRGILNGKFELAWSYIMDYEISFNPFSERKAQITKWKNIAKTTVLESAPVLKTANRFVETGLKTHDALHLACAIEAECDYFITTDKKILKTSANQIIAINPIDFIRILENHE